MMRRFVVALISTVLVISSVLSSGEIEDTTGCGECCNTDFDNCPTKEDKPVKDRWIICQFTNWAWARPGKGAFYPKDIEPELCTHIYYGISLIDDDTLTLKVGNPDNDIGKDFFKKVTDLKSKGPKVMLIIAIYYGSTWDKTISDENRPKFVKSVVEMLERHNFDGVDMGFSSPACPRGNVEKGQSAYNEHVKLFKELQAALKGKYLLSVELPSREGTIEGCFSMKELSDLADWVNLNTYQYHSWQELETGAQAPICGADPVYGVMSYNTLKFYMDTYKYSPDQVTLGIPFYGSTFTMEDANGVAKFGNAVSNSGEATGFLKMEGFATYYEACLHVKNDKWTVGKSKMNGEFIHKGDQFISTPSVADMKRKVCLIKKYKLKGANFWTIDYDDFNDMCGCGKYPLLKTLNKELLGKGRDVNCVL